MMPKRIGFAMIRALCFGSILLIWATAAQAELEESPAVTSISPATTAQEVEMREGMQGIQEALRKFEEYQRYDFIDNSAIPFYDNSSVVVWRPPLETLEWKGTDGKTDMNALFTSVLYEILSNMTFYGADKLVADVLEIYDLDEVITPEGVQELIDVGLPSRDEMMVAVWETGFLNDVVTELTGLMARQENLTEFYEEPFEGLILIFNQLIRDSDNMLWKDLSVILGDPLGKALIPVLNSSIAQDATDDPQAIESSTKEIMPRLLDNFKSFAVKNLLYNEYLPVPCLRGEPQCPEDMGYDDITTFDEMYRSTSAGEMSQEEFGQKFEAILFDYLAEKFGYENFEAFVELLLKQIFNDTTMDIVKALSKETPPSNHQVEVLDSLAQGNYSLEIEDEDDLLSSGFSPKTAVCMANITAAMFEYPDITKAWTDGLGLETVSTFPLAGDLSPRGAVFVDPAQNAVIIGVEGTPYIFTYFLRGLFGWLKCIVQADGSAFAFPCEGESAENQRCHEMKEKYSNAWIYDGFAPFDSVMKDDLDKALGKAVDVIHSKGGVEGIKPKLYIAGHSLGGALAKNVYAQVLLRGFDEAFSSVSLYASAGPVVGNEDYVKMIQDMTKQANASVFQLVNEYDPVPYLPTIDDVDKGPLTLMYEVKTNTLRRAEPLPPYESSPSNILLSELGYHAIKSQYLPLARTLMNDFDAGNCERICSIEQCGLFKCPDTCQGAL